MENKERRVIVTEQPSLSDMGTMAKSIADSGMFGIKNEAQAMSLMLLCQAEGIHPVMALRRYHIIEGKPAFRADALQGEFEREGGILWHCRDDKECSATFWRHAPVGQDVEPAVKRAMGRYKKLKAGQDATDLAWPNEITIIRTMTDAIEKKLAMSYDYDSKQWKMKKNWSQSPRQMLHARCLTEGVRAINPGLVAGIYTEDEIRDFETPEYDQRPSAEIIEQNVREATANATEVMPSGGTVTTHADGSTSATMPDRFAVKTNEYGPMTINEGNYKDRISHFGKAGGRILGLKVGDMERPVIEWMYKNWREGLGPSASEDDIRLRTAIELAYKDITNTLKDLSSDTKNAPVDTNAGRGNVDSGSDVKPSKPESESSDSPAQKDIGSRQAFINDLRGRIDSLVLTEEQAVFYMAKYSVGEQTWKMLDDLPEAMLAYLCTPNGWQTFKETYEKEAKPKVVQKPKRVRRKK